MGAFCREFQHSDAVTVAESVFADPVFSVKSIQDQKVHDWIKKLTTLDAKDDAVVSIGKEISKRGNFCAKCAHA